MFYYIQPLCRWHINRGQRSRVCGYELETHPTSAIHWHYNKPYPTWTTATVASGQKAALTYRTNVIQSLQSLPALLLQNLWITGFALPCLVNEWHRDPLLISASGQGHTYMSVLRSTTWLNIYHAQVFIKSEIPLVHFLENCFITFVLNSAFFT